MIKIENVEVVGWEHAIRGMRNPMNSWDKSDSGLYPIGEHGAGVELGENDHDLMMRLRNAGTDHRKYMRMITVYLDITAPLYWWKEYDTYKVGTVANSCSTMHKIADKEFELADFSIDRLEDEPNGWIKDANGNLWCSSLTHMETTVNLLNAYRHQYLETDALIANSDADWGERMVLTELRKKYWYQMIQLLPSSYNQRRTVMLNYEVLANMYRSRKGHKLDEWREFCRWIESLPYSEIVTGNQRMGEANNE